MKNHSWVNSIKILVCNLVTVDFKLLKPKLNSNLIARNKLTFLGLLFFITQENLVDDKFSRQNMTPYFGAVVCKQRNNAIISTK